MVRKIGLTSVSIATEIGVSPSAVSRAIERGQESMQRQDIEKRLTECQ